jgi:hypothetical protein
MEERVGDEFDALIISTANHKELFVQVKDTVVVVSPLPPTDTKQGD